MTLEELMKQGLTEEQAKKVLDLHKQAIDGNYVPKATFEAEREKVKTANATIAERDKQITELGKFQGTAQELQAKVDTLTQENAAAKTEYEGKLAKMEQETALKLAIADKVYSADDILPKLDLTKITFKDGAVVAGLVEQMDALKKTSPHYFKPESNERQLPPGWQPFGRKPDESSGSQTPNIQEQFGKDLAAAASTGDAFATKANETYFS